VSASEREDVLLRRVPAEQESILGAVDPHAAVTELITKVRIEATGSEDTAIRAALKHELDRIAQLVGAEPRPWTHWADGTDVPGDAFERLVDGADRRSAGQFQTPKWAADVMAGWLLERPVRLLLDPGVGSGRLFLAAAKTRLHRPGRMLGLDIDPVSLAMANLNMILRDLQQVELRHTDFLLDDLRERPDAVICNPPYSRHHVIPSTRKEAIHSGFERRLGLRFSHQAGLHVLFLVRALECLQDGGRMAFITPSQWLHANYGLAIKKLLLERVRIDGLIVFDNDEPIFAGASTAATIVLISHGHAPRETAPVVRLRVPYPPVTQVLAALAGRKSPIPVENAELRPDQPWDRPATPPRRGRRLGELARVCRGIATGCNSFFVLSEADRRAHKLNRRYLLPCIATPRLIPDLELSLDLLEQLPIDTARWLLACRHPAAEHRGDALGRYLRYGRIEHRADQSYLARHRRPWYAPERRDTAPILFTYLNKKRPRFIRNRAGAAPLNTFLILEPVDGIDADALWAALNRPSVLDQLMYARRDYGRGLWKIERHELDQLRVRL